MTLGSPSCIRKQIFFETFKLKYFIELVYSYRDRGAINTKDKNINILELVIYFT